MDARKLEEVSHDAQGRFRAIAEVQVLRETFMKAQVRKAAAIWGATALELFEMEPAERSS